jgi:hypothetical protein
MSKRNFILLIIVVIIILAGVAGFLYFKKDSTMPSNDNESEGTNFISQFNPFASNPAPGTTSTPPPSDTGEYQPGTEGEVPALKLQKISSMPVAGFTTFSKERLKEGATTKPLTEFAPAVRYVERATGNIYQTFVDKIKEQKFSSTIIPKVHEAYFGNRGESVIMRYLKENGRTIETFYSILPKDLLVINTQTQTTTEPVTETTKEIKGGFLPEDVKDISVSPDGSKIFYLFNSGSNVSESATGTILNLSTNKKVQIFNSPFTEWLSLWPSNNIITLTTKPAANIEGYMYSMDAVGKNLKKVLSGINGLTTLTSPNGKLVLWSDDRLALNIFYMDKRNSDLLGLRTLPEKCVWSKSSESLYCAVPKSVGTNLYPDSWYQGEVSFNDQLWKIDMKTGNTTLLLDPVAVTGAEEIDGIKLALDEGENYLFFVNKKDSFLWKLDLK